MFKNLIDIVTSPNAAMARLKASPSVLFPLLLTMVLLASLQIGYVMLSDSSYLIDQMIEQALASNPNARESEIRPALENLNPAVLAISGAVGTPLVILIIYSLYAAYLNFMGKFQAEELNYKHWFSLLAWTGIPVLFTVLAGWIVILSSSNGQIPQTELQPFSLDSLLALHSNKTIMQQLSLPQFWTMGLMVLGYRNFTGSSWLKSTLISLGPYLLIFGLWGYFSF